MSQPILLRYNNVAGVIPGASELAIRELAINTADGVLFAKTNSGNILQFKDASTFALAVHMHGISDINGLQAALDDLSSAAQAAQDAADASLKIASNLSDLNDVAAARTNLSVYSKSQVDTAVSGALSDAKGYTDTKISDLIGAAPETLDTLKEIADALSAGSDVATGLTSSIGAVADRVSTLEGQNLDSRITTAQSTADAALVKSSNLSDLTSASAARTNLGLGTIATQDANSVSISGGSLTGTVTFGSSSATLPTDAGVLLTDQSTIDGGSFGSLAA